jgi:hypothetical protein
VDGSRDWVFVAATPLRRDERGPLNGDTEPFRDVATRIDWTAGTRRASRAELHLEPWNAKPLAILLEPIAHFPRRGLGFVHPDWSHGTWKGELAVGADEVVVDDLDPLDVHNLHVRQLCRATCGDEVGLGVLEQLVIGPHAPSGIVGFLDAAR